MVEEVWSRLGRAEVDLFATRKSAHCPLFSLRSDDPPLGWDALAHDRVQALSAVVCVAVVLRPNPAFLPKVLTDFHLSQSVELRFLSASAADQLAVCPVRALSEYI